MMRNEWVGNMEGWVVISVDSWIVERGGRLNVGIMGNG